jgi:hypothetical protein
LQILEDNFLEVANAVLAAHESGDLAAAVAGGHDTFKKWINGVGKAQKRKGKRLFMPMRVALTVRPQAILSNSVSGTFDTTGQLVQGGTLGYCCMICVFGGFGETMSDNCALYAPAAASQVHGDVH